MPSNLQEKDTSHQTPVHSFFEIAKVASIMIMSALNAYQNNNVTNATYMRETQSIRLSCLKVFFYIDSTAL